MAIVSTPDSSSQDTRTPVKVFLAGSIEMGKARDWQKEAIDSLRSIDDLTIYSPRVADTSKWAVMDPTILGPDLKAQIEWEQEKIASADIVFFMFLGDAKSPISLLEYGMCLGMGKEVVLVVEPQFWRRGNLYYMQSTYRPHEPVHHNLKDGLEYLRLKVYQELTNKN